jgi:hypothetical protein
MATSAPSASAPSASHASAPSASAPSASAPSASAPSASAPSATIGQPAGPARLCRSCGRPLREHLRCVICGALTAYARIPGHLEEPERELLVIAVCGPCRRWLATNGVALAAPGAPGAAAPAGAGGAGGAGGGSSSASSSESEEPEAERLLTVHEAALLIRRSPATVRRLARNGRLHAKRLRGTRPTGDRLLIPKRAVLRLVDASEEAER